MLSQHIKQQYLSAMGITHWRERIAVPLSVFKASTHLVVAKPMDAQTQELWQKIQTVLERASGACLTVSPDALLTLCKQCPTVIFLGGIIADEVSYQSAIVTHSLEMMIAQPQLKAQVWDVFKRQIFNKS